MLAYRLASLTGFDALTLRDEPTPVPGPNQVLVRVRASSLNYRDLLVVKGQTAGRFKPDLIPLSDGAGEIVETGPGVTRVKPGDRVAGAFFQRWIAGKQTPDAMGGILSGDFDGMLAEYAVLEQAGVVPLPAHLSFEEGATLPCAAVTAWAGLTGLVTVAPGDTVLTLGTGGLSIFALQFAKLMGAVVIATTSGEEKAERLTALGADAVVNYTARPDWEKAVREATGGRGVDHVVEVGGPGTLEKSLQSLVRGGHVALIGVLAGTGNTINPYLIRTANAVVRSISLGSRADFEAMNKAIDAHRLRPVIDRVFPFAEARQAFEHFDGRLHFGKVVIRHD